jgi:hypothetical protein
MFGLWDAERCGLNPRWMEEDMVYLEKCLQEKQKTYSSSQLAQKSEKERYVHLSNH